MTYMEICEKWDMFEANIYRTEIESVISLLEKINDTLRDDFKNTLVIRLQNEEIINILEEHYQSGNLRLNLSLEHAKTIVKYAKQALNDDKTHRYAKIDYQHIIRDINKGYYKKFNIEMVI